MLTTYQEIRDRIYMLARKHDLRVDWIESNRQERRVMLYDSRQTLVASALVRVLNVSPRSRAQLTHELEGVFGEGWMN